MLVTVADNILLPMAKICRLTPDFRCLARAAAWLLMILALVSTRTLAAAPPNDDVVNAIQLTGLSVTATGSNVDATLEANDPVLNVVGAGGKSVWWKWTSPETRNYKFTTAGS